MSFDSGSNYKYPKQNDVPRRNKLYLNTPSELAITNAIQEVEKLGADITLTEAINLLSKAKGLVSDYIDSKA